MSDEQAYCPCRRVDLWPVDQGDGTVKDEWRCQSCGCVFDRRSAGLGWVPVPNEEDEPDAWAAFEFPPDHELWLIYNYEQGREIGFRRDGAWWVANTDRAMWVTHMQPLPAPPEGE